MCEGTKSTVSRGLRGSLNNADPSIGTVFPNGISQKQNENRSEENKPNADSRRNNRVLTSTLFVNHNEPNINSHEPNEIGIRNRNQPILEYFYNIQPEPCFDISATDFLKILLFIYVAFSFLNQSIYHTDLAIIYLFGPLIIGFSTIYALSTEHAEFLLPFLIAVCFHFLESFLTLYATFYLKRIGKNAYSPLMEFMAETFPDKFKSINKNIFICFWPYLLLQIMIIMYFSVCIFTILHVMMKFIQKKRQVIENAQQLFENGNEAGHPYIGLGNNNRMNAFIPEHQMAADLLPDSRIQDSPPSYSQAILNTSIVNEDVVESISPPHYSNLNNDPKFVEFSNNQSFSSTDSVEPITTVENQNLKILTTTSTQSGIDTTSSGGSPSSSDGSIITVIDKYAEKKS